MKLLQMTEKIGAKFGVRRMRPGESSPFNRLNLAFSLLFGQFFISSTAFFLYDANTFYEYTLAFFGWMTWSFINVGYIVIILISPDIFGIADSAEAIIERRKFFSLFQNYF